MTNSLPETVKPSVMGRLSSMMEMWAFAAFLPLPVLVAIDPVRSADISCIYLGVTNAWLVAEYHRAWGLPESATLWRVRLLVITTAIAVNVALFVGFGLAAGIETHFPLPVMALLSVIPVIGIMPWMLRLTSPRPYAAIILSGFLVFACKLAGCVVARLVYGPDYIALGVVAADWRTAKLMITLLWAFSTLLSLGLFLADFKSCTRKDHDHAA